jgi:hypothetical protein
MKPEFEAAFTKLKSVFGKAGGRLCAKTDSAAEYEVVTKRPSPFPQHKGHRMWFGCVRVGKAYVSLHLLPLYMNPTLTKTISPELKKRMQGKACFNFKSAPEPATLAELKKLVAASLKHWKEKEWA